MSGQSAHSAPAPESEEEQGLDEKKAAQQAQQAFAEEVPETQMISFVLQVAGGLGLLHISNRAQVIEAFRTLNSKYFIHNALDIKDPRKLREIQQALQVAGKEMTDKKKKWDKQGKKQDYVEVGIGGLKQRLSFADYQRKSQSVKIAGIVHNRVNAEIITEKFRNTKSAFGLSDENNSKLKRGLAEWLRKNPGSSVDDYLAIHGKRYYCEQNGLEEKRLNGQQKEELKKKSTDLHKKNEETVKNTQNSEETIGRYKAGRRAIRDTLNPNIPLPQIDYQLSQSILNGTYQQKIQPALQPQPATTSTLPSKPVQSPIISKIPAKFTLPRVSLPKISFSGLSNHFKPLGNLFSGLKQGLGSIFGKATSFIADKINPLKIAAHKLINRGLDAIAPGLGLAVEGLNKAIKQLTGIDLEDILIKFTLKAAVFAVLAIVTVFILIIFGTSSLFSTNTASNPIIINTTTQSSTQIYSWKEFEEKYLTRTYSP